MPYKSKCHLTGGGYVLRAPPPLQITCVSFAKYVRIVCAAPAYYLRCTGLNESLYRLSRLLR